jgi:arylsulfatase A-like enzyme
LSKLGVPGADVGLQADDSTEDPRYGRVGRQRIEDTGRLTRKRMETIDDEVLDVALDFLDRQAADESPFFCWFNTTHMHFRTHPKPESLGQAGRRQSPYHDTMIDHDKSSARCWTSSTHSAWPRTRSSSTARTTGRT